MTALSILRVGSPTSWFADWLLADPPPDIEVIQPPPTVPPSIQIVGTIVKHDGKVYVLTGNKWMDYWEGKWPD